MLDDILPLPFVFGAAGAGAGTDRDEEDSLAPPERLLAAASRLFTEGAATAAGAAFPDASFASLLDEEAPPPFV